MPNNIQYAIFKTGWGHFGLVAGPAVSPARDVARTPGGALRRRLADRFLLRTHLPHKNRTLLKNRLLKDLPHPEFDNNLLPHLQQRIMAYFAGACVDFTDVPVLLDGLPPFTRRVLSFCQKIPYGKTLTYSRLAGKLGNPAAARAVGSALAHNPIPLIIPCHRILRSGGSLGGFSAPGGTQLKAKLLNLEARVSGRQ